MSVLDDLLETKDITLQQILNNLLDASENLDLKTHIIKPRQLASLFILGNYLGVNKYEKSSALIDGFINTYLRYMISFKRMSRAEIIKALSRLMDNEETLTTANRLTKNLK